MCMQAIVPALMGEGVALKTDVAAFHYLDDGRDGPPRAFSGHALVSSGDTVEVAPGISVVAPELEIDAP